MLSKCVEGLLCDAFTNLVWVLDRSVRVFSSTIYVTEIFKHIIRFVDDTTFATDIVNIVIRFIDETTFTTKMFVMMLCALSNINTLVLNVKKQNIDILYIEDYWIPESL